MNKNTKIYLATSLILLALGVIALLSQQAAVYPVLYVPLPVGAVFFGLFLVSAFLGNEADKFVAEQHAHEQAIESHQRKG